MKISGSLKDILLPAYAPCPEFERACTEMRWNPKLGHVPRGFLGAFGDPSEVELVLVFAEPGDPHSEEAHFGLDSAFEYASMCISTGKDQFHRNVRRILGMCWPHCTFEEQMRKVWLTESVLCSAPKEGGHVGFSSSLACGQRYLIAQLDLFRNALIVGVGSKARDRLHRLGLTAFLAVHAVAPPGCNRPIAAESWKKIPVELERRRRLSPP